MTDTLTTFNVGDRVRLTDAGGDSFSSAVVGDIGTVRHAGERTLTVTMDKDGHETQRNVARWEKVTEEDTPELTEAQKREVWAALPIAEAYPVGSQWHHSSYGDTIHTVVSHVGARTLMMRDENTGVMTEWPRGALDLYGTPVSPVPPTPDPSASDALAEPTEAPTEPYRPTVGDRVIVTNDPDQPANNGKPAEVLEVRERTYPIRVKYDDGSGYGSWWVKEVKPELPATPEEFHAAIAAAVEKATEEAKREGRREGRQAATEEAARHLESIVSAAHDYATENNLCERFDEFMIENGLEPRDSYEKTYDVTVTYTVTVTARPDDEEAIHEAAMERVNSGWESPEVDWEEA